MKILASASAQVSCFLLIIFSGLCTIVVHAVLLSQREPQPIPSWQSILDGSYTRQVDDIVVAAVPETVSLDGFVAGIEYRVLDDAGPQVRAGCPNWLFLGEEIAEVSNGEQNLADHAALARYFSAEFRKRHIRFVMLTVPDKARIEHRMLCGQRTPEQERLRLTRWQSLAKTIPATVVPALEPWPRAVSYWRTDTHWNRLGAAFVAARTAEVIRDSLRSDAKESAAVSVAPDFRIRPGDLLHLSKLADAPVALQPKPDFDKNVSVIWKRTGGLFDAGPPADVLLVGSSFSKNSGFIDSLQLDLKHEVVQLSEDGSEFDGSLFDVLDKYPGALAKAKVLIWEFPERSLSQDLSGRERSIVTRMNTGSKDRP